MTAQPGSARIALLTGGFHLILSVCLDGHVPSTGLDPPADPVLVYRNDSEKGSRPSVKPAQEFHLIWRQNGRSPVTMWEPLPPQGYRALGTVHTWWSHMQSSQAAKRCCASERTYVARLAYLTLPSGSLNRPTCRYICSSSAVCLLYQGNVRVMYFKWTARCCLSGLGHAYVWGLHSPYKLTVPSGA